MDKKINIPLLCIFFYMAFPILFKGISSYQQMALYVISIIGIIFNIKKISKLMFKGKVIYACIAYVIVLLASVILPYIYITNDYTYFKKLLDIFYTSLKYIFVICIFISIHKEDATLDLFFKYYIYICCLLVLTTFVFLIFPNLKTEWSSIIYNTGLNVKLTNMTKYISRYSIIGYTGFRQSFLCVVSFIFSIYLVLKNNAEQKNNKKNTRTYIFTALLSLTGTVFYGRIGMLVIIFISIFLIPKFIKTKRNLKVFIAIIIVLVIAISIINILKENNAIINTWYNWAFEIFLNYLENDTINTTSSDALTSMYFMPETYTLIYGDGKYTTSSGGYYMSTDVGLIRAVLFYGVFFTVIGYMVLIFACLGVNDKLNFLKNNSERKIIFIIFIATLIFELKGEIYQYVVPIILCIHIILEYQIQNTLKKENKYDY